jgi:hypothetical protein
MNFKAFVVLCVIVFLSMSVIAAPPQRDWQSGMLMETEQQKVKQGSTTTSSTDGSAKPKGNKVNYSENTTTRTNDDVDTYQIYTLRGTNKTYVAREQLLFPWSKPANVSVGEQVKYVVDKNKLILLDDDGKEHKATITKVSVTSTH